MDRFTEHFGWLMFGLGGAAGVSFATFIISIIFIIAK